MFCSQLIISANVLALGEVANFVTVYFPLKIKFLAERKREFTTKFAILPNGCWTKPSVALLMILYLTNIIKIRILWLQKKEIGRFKGKQNYQSSQTGSSRIWGTFRSFWANRFNLGQKPKYLFQLFAPCGGYFALFWQNRYWTWFRTSTGLLVLSAKKVKNSLANLFQTLCLRA